MTQISADLGGGATKINLRLTSQCVGGRQATIEVNAGGFSVGFGFNLGATSGSADFDDGLSTIDTTSFDGPAKYVGAGFTLGGFDPSIQKYGWQKRGPSLSCQAVQLGQARYVDCGSNIGLEATISGGAGWSSVTSVQWSCCGNK